MRNSGVSGQGTSEPKEGGWSALKIQRLEPRTATKHLLFDRLERSDLPAARQAGAIELFDRTQGSLLERPCS